MKQKTKESLNLAQESIHYSSTPIAHEKPYITWGYPNLKTVRELIYKRGHGKVSFSLLVLSRG